MKIQYKLFKTNRYNITDYLVTHNFHKAMHLLKTSGKNVVYCDKDETSKVQKIKNMLPNVIYRMSKSKTLTAVKFTYSGTGESSPNNINFYLSRGFNTKTAAALLEKFRSCFAPFVYKKTGKSGRPSTVEYWKNNGYTLEQARQMVYEFQIQSLKFFTTHYGEHEGTKKYQEIYEKKQLAYKQRHEKCLEKIAQNKKISIKKAKELNRQHMASISPRTTVYWQNKGYSFADAKSKVRQWQSEMSPRTIHYWLDRGFSEKEAKIKVSNFQSHNSIAGLMSRYNCTEVQAQELQTLLYQQNINCLLFRNNYEEKKKMKFLLYSSHVRHLSLLNYKRYKKIIDPKSLRSKKYHMDHKYSITNGYLNGIPPEIIASPYNLEIITEQKNYEKGQTNSITLQELYRKINENKTNLQIQKS